MDDNTQQVLCEILDGLSEAEAALEAQRQNVEALKARLMAEEEDTKPPPPPPPPDPNLPKEPVTREVPMLSAALLIHEHGDGQVRLELMYPEEGGDNMPLTVLVAAHAMEYITLLKASFEE